MNIPPLDIQPQAVSTNCAITGEPLEMGYPIESIVPDSAGEFLDLLSGNNQSFLSDNAARCFKGTWNMGAWIFFEDGTGQHPLIARDAALKQNRPCWSNLVRDVARNRSNQQVVCILTTDFKKRLWPRAKIGIIGESTLVYIHDSDLNISDVVCINWLEMIETLNFIESLLNAGYSKPSVFNSLLNHEVASKNLKTAIQHEKRLMAIRQTNEFKFAYLIAQKI